MEVDVRGWMAESERLYLRKLAFQKDVLELGAYEGLSTLNLACTAKHVTTVDTFDGRATPEPGDTYAAFQRNISGSGMSDKVSAVRGRTDEVLPVIRKKHDLIFVDCDHSYEAVKKDIELSLPLLVEGGVLAFHDYGPVDFGVIRAVDEFLAANPDWKKIGCEHTLLAIQKNPPAPKKPHVYLAMPHRNGEVSLGASTALHYASTKVTHTVSDFGTSVLTMCFNYLFCDALNARERGVTHFAMLHSDVAPARGWLDVMMAEMDRGGYDCLSAVVPLKNDKGLTSTGIDTPGDPWQVRRLTMFEVFNLPETFAGKDVPFRRDEAQLLLNTGCWVMKLDQPWVDGLCFRQQDRVGRDRATGRFVYGSITEDWDFSRQLHTRGAKIAATRKVPLYHERQEIHNHSVWGKWARDEDFAKAVEEEAAYQREKDHGRGSRGAEGARGSDRGECDHRPSTGRLDPVGGDESGPAAAEHVDRDGAPGLVGVAG